jgi:hypothetical protein
VEPVEPELLMVGTGEQDPARTAVEAVKALRQLRLVQAPRHKQQEAAVAMVEMARRDQQRILQPAQLGALREAAAAVEPKVLPEAMAATGRSLLLMPLLPAQTQVLINSCVILPHSLYQQISQQDLRGRGAAYQTVPVFLFQTAVLQLPM